MQSFDTPELFFKYRYPLLILLIGGVLITGGIFLFKSGLSGGTKVEILTEKDSTISGKILTVEIAGEVIRPGVYKLTDGSRIDDLLIKSGGFSKDVDTIWTDKYLNRAAPLTDGQKVYIPNIGEQTLGASAKNGGLDQSTSSSFSSDSSGKININTASLGQLDSLPGIGPVYGQSIIDHRPYSNGQELVSKGSLKQSTYDKIKDLITVY